MADGQNLHDKLGMGADKPGEEMPSWAIPPAPGELTVPGDLTWARELVNVGAPPPSYLPRDVLSAILGAAPLPESEGPGTIDDILRRILGAETIADALTDEDAVSLDHVFGLVLVVDEPRWFPSEFTGGASAFCVVRATEEQGGLTHRLVIGSQQPQVILWRAWVEDQLPIRCRFVKSAKPTKAGFYPYNLVKA